MIPSQYAKLSHEELVAIGERAIRRLKRIEATARWSRIHGWQGAVPGTMIDEYVALKRLFDRSQTI